jgi:hypothetical protein
MGRFARYHPVTIATNYCVSTRTIKNSDIRSVIFTTQNDTLNEMNEAGRTRKIDGPRVDNSYFTLLLIT